MAERAQDLPVVSQQGPSPGKDRQVGGPSGQSDSGYYPDSLDQTSPACGQTSKEQTENGATGGAALCDTGGVKEKQGSVKLSGSGGQDVPTEQPREVEDNTRSFPVIGPRILDNEHVASCAVPVKPPATHNGEVAGEADTKKPQQDSQPPLSCSSTSRAVPDSDMPGAEADLTSLNSSRIVQLSILSRIEKTAYQAKNDLVHQPAEVDPTALHKMLLNTFLQISEDSENLLMATQTSHTPKTPVINVRKGAPCSKNPTEAHTNLPVSSSSHQNLQVGEDNNTENPVQVETAPNSTQDSVQVGTAPNSTEEQVGTALNSSEESVHSTEKSEQVVTGPKSTEDPVHFGTAPNSTEDSVQVRTATNCTQDSEQVGAAPNSTDDSEQVETAFNSTEDSVQVGIALNSTEESVQVGIALNSTEESVQVGIALNSTEESVQVGTALNSTEESVHSTEESEQVVTAPKSTEDPVHFGTAPNCTEDSVQVGTTAPDSTEDPVQMRTAPNSTEDSVQVVTTAPNNTEDSVQLGTAPDSTEDSVQVGTAPKSTEDSVQVGTTPNSTEDSVQVGTAPNSTEDLMQVLTALKGTDNSESEPVVTAPNSIEDVVQVGTAPNSTEDSVQVGTAPYSTEDSVQVGTAPYSTEDSVQVGTAPNSTEDSVQVVTAPKSVVASNNAGNEGQPKKLASNTQVKSGLSEEQTKSILSKNPLKGNPPEDKDKTQVPSNTHVKRPQSNEPKSVDLPMKPLKEDPLEVKHKTGAREVLHNNPRKEVHQDKAEVQSNTKVKGGQSEDPEKSQDLSNNRATKEGHQGKDNTQPVPSNIQVNRPQSEEEEKGGDLLLNKQRKEYELIIQTPENTSSHNEGDKTLLEDSDIETLKKVKNWMNLKIPPDVTSNYKTNTTPFPVDQDALVYNVQRQDEEVLGDSWDEDEEVLGDSSDEDDDEEQDGYHQPVWLAQLADDDVEDEDLYLGSEDTIAFPEPGAAAGPMFCSEVPENGQIAVGGGVSISPFNNPSQIGDHVHPSQHSPTTSAQGLQNASDMSLEEALQRYRRTERGMTVTVLGLGEQVVSQTRVYDPTTLQEHILEHTAEQAFDTYPMDGFTLKMPGGRTVPLEMPLDPWSSTFQNIIFQLHQANHGDSTWLWRVTHSENTEGGRYSVEINMHSVGRGVTRVPDNPDDRGSGLDCCICQDTEPGGTDSLVETSCRHKFHEICLFKWLQEQDICPLCKRRILTS